MALTAAQIADIRDYTGDAAQKVSDAKLDLDYTTAGEDFNLTVVLVLRRLLGIYFDSMDKSTELASERISQRYDHLKDRLAYWERMAGVSAGQSIAASTTHVYRADSGMTEEPDYTEGR